MYCKLNIITCYRCISFIARTHSWGRYSTRNISWCSFRWLYTTFRATWFLGFKHLILSNTVILCYFQKSLTKSWIIKCLRNILFFWPNQLLKQWFNCLRFRCNRYICVIKLSVKINTVCICSIITCKDAIWINHRYYIDTYSFSKKLCMWVIWQQPFK